MLPCKLHYHFEVSLESQQFYELFCPLEANNEVLSLTTAHMDMGKVEESPKWDSKFSNP